MATFMEEYVKRFRFYGCGYAGEKNTFTADDGSVNRYLPVYVMGKTFNFRVEDDAEFATLPAEGTSLIVQGYLKRRKSGKGLTGALANLIYQGKQGWRQPTDAEFLAGLRFEGSGVVAVKKGGVYAGNDYRNVQVAVLGDTLLFSHVEPSVFDKIQEGQQAMFMGRLDAQIINVANSISDELIPIIQQYRVFEEVKQAEPAKKPAA